MKSNSKSIAFFGGTGGLGSKVVSQLQRDYDIHALGSNQVDLTQLDQIKAYFSQNKPDIVVIFSNYNYNSFLHKYNSEDGYTELVKQINLNITGVTTCITEALSIMRASHFGRIIIASSVTVSHSVPGTSIYAACKSFFENLVKTIALENASKGITANCIQLGYMDGGLTYTLPEPFLKEVVEKIPTKRLGTIDEIATTVDFLIKNSYINGTTIKLTGGL